MTANALRKPTEITGTAQTMSMMEKSQSVTAWAGPKSSLVVANDGWLSGHSKHALDTIGRCGDDFDNAKNDDDSKEDKDKDHKISASDAGYAIGLTPSLIACLKGAPGNTFPIKRDDLSGCGT